MNTADTRTTGTEARSFPIKRVLVYACAVACLAWVFHGVHPRRLLAAMTITNWGFVALAVTVDILTYVLQGIRWRLLLAPVGRLSSLRAMQGIYAGLFTNELVPLRLGEFVRAFLVSRWLSSGLTSVLPSIVVERFLDALWLAAGIGLAAIFVPLPNNLILAGDVLGSIVLAAILLLVWIVFRREKQLERSEGSSSLRFLARLSQLISRLAGGLRDIGISRRLYLAALFSAAMLACQALALWFMALACGIELPFWAGIIVLLVVRLGTAIPNAPANVGSFQFFTVLGLGLFGVEKTVAAGFSIVYFLALTAPLWILGLLAISRAGVSLATLRLEAANSR
jgi:glycosyltransferase 2 family protein